MCIGRLNRSVAKAHRGARKGSVRTSQTTVKETIVLEWKNIYIHLKEIFVNRLNKTMRLEEQMGKWNKQMEKFYF